MFRKTILALAATAALGAAALAPTSASAGWKGGWGHHGGYWGHGWGHGYGISLYTPSFYDVGGCYTVKRLVDTPFGPKFRRVTVCN